MVDVGEKPVTARKAVARGKVLVKRETLELISSGSLPKGDVLTIAQTAGIMAAKKTSDLIPLCHPLNLTGVNVQIQLDKSEGAINVEASVTVEGKTGAEMEALTAVAVSCLTIYDMCKSVDKDMEITGIHLVMKSGGKSGTFSRGGTE